MNKEHMTDSELVSFLSRKIEHALNDEDNELSSTRQEALDYYLGEGFGDERDGYSSYVSREVLEAIEWALPSCLRIFTAGDRVVTYDAVGPEDEAAADQETDVINHMLLKQNDGFMMFYSWFKDALMYPNGYVKMWADETVSTHKKTYANLNPAELLELVNTEGVEILEASVEESLEFGELFSVKAQHTDTQPKLTVEPTPPEQVLIDNDLLSLNIDDADFVCHRVQRTQSWLIQNGYDQKELEAIGDSDDHSFNDERTNRLFFTDENPDGEGEDDDAQRKLWVHECYVQIDFDRDGVSERRKIVMIGNEIFENEEYEYQPFIALSSVPMTHKHAGLSLAELVKDLQRIKSALTRQLLDNLYRQNIRRKYVGERALIDDGSTMDALLDASSEIIPCLDESAIREEMVQSIIPEILPVIQHLDDRQQVRTGVTPNMALDPATLQQSTMGAFMGALEQASQRIEMINRIFAETGVKALMRKAHELSREHMDKSLALKLRGEWVNVNPSEWRERVNLSVNVGLGFNNKDQLVQMLMSMLNIQKEAIAAGLTDTSKIYNTLERLVEAAGFKDAGRFFTNPAQQPPQAPQPDPMQEALQKQHALEMQGLQIKLQDQERKNTETQAKVEDMALKHLEKMTELELKFRQNIPGAAI